MSISLSERDANRSVASPDINSEFPSIKGKLATSLDEMLSYQAIRRLSTASSGKANVGKFGSNYANSWSSPSSKRSQRSNRTHRGRSGSPGFITVDGITPLKADSVVKPHCPVVTENDLPLNIVTPIGSEHATEVNVDSPSASIKTLKALGHSTQDVKKKRPVGSDIISTKLENSSVSDRGVKAENSSASGEAPEVEKPTLEDVKKIIAADSNAVTIKSENPSSSNHDIKTESTSTSDHDVKIETSASVHIKTDIPVVTDNHGTIKVEDALPEAKAGTRISDDSEPELEIKVESGEAPVVTPSVKVRVVSYHRNADINVRVRNDSRIGYEYYRVRKDTVSGASDVFEKQFSSGSSTGDVLEVVSMMDEDDCPVGLNIVFSLLHHKYHELPNRLSIPALHGLAKVVEKYQLAHLLVPFAEKWLVQDLNYSVIMAGDKLNNERVMLLTWIFGEGRWFSRTFPKVAKEATLVDGALMGADGPFAGRYPQKLIDIMARHRHECLQKVRQSIDQPLQDLIKGSRIYCRSKDATAEIKEACSCQQLGSMISCLTAAGLIPFPDPAKYKGSVMDLVRELEKVRSMRYKVPGISPHLDTHHMCGIRHQDAVSKVAAEPIRLTAQLFNDFKRRGEKTGVFSKELYNELRVAHATTWVAPLPAFKADPDHYAQEGWEEAMEDN